MSFYGMPKLMSKSKSSAKNTYQNINILSNTVGQKKIYKYLHKNQSEGKTLGLKYFLKKIIHTYHQDQSKSIP